MSDEPVGNESPVFGRRSYFQVPRSLGVLLVGLCFALLAVDGFLLDRNASLRALSSEYFRLLQPPVGRVVPPLSGVGPDGKQVVVEYGKDARKTILFVFSPTCHVCDVNWPTWQALSKRIDPKSYRLVFVNISTALPQDYAVEKGIAAYVVISRLDPVAGAVYNLHATPETVVLSDFGRIESVWVGPLSGGALREVESTIGARL